MDRAFEPLSQVYGFVKQSGGHIQIYSELGTGTAIRLYLPRFHGETVRERAATPTLRGQPVECILVVEDDPDARAYVVETLASLGYDVLEAKRGGDALLMMNEHRTIRPLLTDVVMPVMNGRELAGKALDILPGLKMLYMTGYSRNAIVHQGRLDPGVDLIQKPLSNRDAFGRCSTNS